MKTYKLPTYKNGDLQMHSERIFRNFKSNPENLEDSLPKKDYIEDNGEGDESRYLDVPNIEESYFYANEKDRDSDYDKLMQQIDLFKQLIEG